MAFNDNGGFHTLEEILREPKSRDTEERRRHIGYYRRGYHEAWNYAMDIVFSLLDHQVSIKDAYAMMALYEHKLAEWKIEHRESYIDHPSFIREQMQEELQRYRKAKSSHEDSKE